MGSTLGIPGVSPTEVVIIGAGNAGTVAARAALALGATWKDEHTNFVYSNCPNNILVLRFADVLLMYAEADLMLNNGSPSDEGVEAMNRIVQRARGFEL